MSWGEKEAALGGSETYAKLDAETWAGGELDAEEL